MAFEFQYKILRSGEMLNCLRMSADLTRAAQEVSQLDNENLTDSMLASQTVGTEAYHAFRVGTFSSHSGGSTPTYGVGTGSNPNFEGGLPATYNNPATGATNIYVIESNGAWNTVLSQTVTTDEGVVRICAYLTYLVDYYTTGSTNISNSGIQFGLRLDGQDVYFAGCSNASHRPYIPVRANQQRSATNMEPGPQTPVYRHHVAGMGNAAAPVELMQMAYVTAGTHLVELAVRVVRQNISDISIKTAYIYDRSLVVQMLPQEPAATSTVDGPSIADIPTETVANSSVIMTARTDVVRTAENALTPGMLRRQSASHRVLPAVLHDAATVSIANLNSALYITCPYQGYTSTTLAGTDNANGWRLLRDGTNNLRTDATHASAFAVSGLPCLIEVFASVAVQELRLDLVSTPDQDMMAAFTLAYSTDGTNIILVPCTHAWLADNRENHGETYGNDIKTRVSIRGWLDFRTVTSGSDISWFGVYASVVSIVGSAPATTRLRWRCASLDVLVWRY